MNPNAALLRRRAQAALDVHRNEEAARFAREAIAADPEAADGYALLALAELRTNRLREALKTIEAGLSKDAKSEWLHRQRSVVLRGLGRTKQAVASAREAVALAPEIARTHLTLAQALAARRKRAAAQAAAMKGLAIDPDDADLHAMLGDLWVKKKPALAAEHYRRSLAIQPENANVHNNLGVALLRMKRPVDAVLCFKSAVMLDPTLKVAKRNIHSSVKRLIAGGSIFAVILALNLLLRVVLAGHASFVALPVLVAILAASFVYHWIRRRRARQSLVEADPQILQIYETVRRDRRAGRL